MNAPAPVTTTAAPASTPASAPAPAATPTAATTTPAAEGTSAAKPTRAQLRERAVADMKAETAAEATPPQGDAKPAEATPAEPPKPEERPASKLADISRQHRKLVEDQKAHAAAVARDKEMIAASKSDLELVAKIKAGDFTALEAFDPQWYDKASKQAVAKLKPNDPAVIVEQIRAENAKLAAEIEALKNPKPKEPTAEEKDAQARHDAAQKEAFVASVADAVKSDARFTSLQTEDPIEVGKEVYSLVERVWAAEGYPEIKGTDDLRARAERACIQLEAAHRAQKQLTENQGTGTKSAATTHARGQSGEATPQPITPRGQSTLTASMHESVPVGHQQRMSREDRIAAAKAQIREANRNQPG